MKGAFLFAVFAALMVSTYAYCPNLCSGHGTCTAEDKCVCYTQKGTDGGGDDTGAKRAGWTGPDCSLYVCPVAPSFVGGTPNTLSNIVPIDGGGTHTAFKFLSTAYTGLNEFADTAAAGYFPATDTPRGTEIQVFKTADPQERYSMTVYSVSVNTGTDILTVATFESLPFDPSASGYSVAFPKKDSSLANAELTNPATVNGVHERLECSGQGLCDRETGKCDCFPGYGGEACTRTTCPDDCSGHGVCLSLRRLAQDAADAWDATRAVHVAAGGTALSATGSIQVYNGWDADKEYGCKCDTGFRGPACDMQECPSFTDPMNGCGGGPCNNALYDTGSAGVVEATTNLDLSTEAIATSYPFGKTYSACTKDSKCSTLEQRDCSGRGICDYETGQCNCFSGFYGEACQIQTILV